MEFVIFGKEKLNDFVAMNWLPYDLTVINNPIYIFGIMDDKKRLSGIVAFSEDFRNKTRMYLEHIYIVPNYRGSGCRDALLEFAVSELKKIKVSEIRCAKAVDIDDTARFERLMTDCGFSPLILFGRVVLMKQGSLQTNEMQKVSVFANKSASVVKIEDYDDVRLKRFLANSEQTGININRDEYDPRLCRFYIENNQIMGAICLKFRNNRDIFLIGTYKDDESNFPYMVPYLMSELTEEIKAMGNPGESVVMKIYSDNLYNAIVKTSTNETKELILQEYIFEI